MIGIEKGEQRSNSRYTDKAESTRFTEGLDVGDRGKEVPEITSRFSHIKVEKDRGGTH